MSEAPRSWEDYFYPLPPDSGPVPEHARVLRNIPGITNVWDLMDYERDATLLRTLQIATGEIPIEPTFDADYLSAVHRAIFQDVYEWAGQFRTVDMRKMRPPSLWADEGTPEYEQFAPAAVIRDGLDFIAGEIRDIPWEVLDQHGVALAMAQTHTQLTYVHPFREGNGRTTRIFLEQLAERAGYEVTAWPDPQLYLHAVVEANRGRYTELTSLIETQLTERPETPRPITHVQRAKALNQAITPAAAATPQPAPVPQALPPVLRAD